MQQVRTILIWLTFCFTSISLSNERGPNLLDVKDGLKGQVKSVTEETLEFESKAGERLAERITWKERCDYIYNSEGYLIEKVRKVYHGYNLARDYSYASLLTNEKVIFNYKSNFLTEETAFSGRGFLDKYDYNELKSKTILKYDESGRVSAIEYYDKTGSMTYRANCVYHDGKLAEISGGGRQTKYKYLSNGRVQARYVEDWGSKYGKRIEITIYDRNDNLLESTHQVPKQLFHREGNYKVNNGVITYKLIYEYDDFDHEGNWTKRKQSEWVTKFGKSYYEPMKITHREITYYP